MKSDISSTLKFLVLGGLFVYIIFFPVSDIVGGIRSTSSFLRCHTLENSSDKVICQRKAIRTAVQSGSVNTAISLYKSAIRVGAIDCHFLGHEVGRDFYEVFKERGFARVGEPMSECGYGFWHGFMTGVAQDFLTTGEAKVDLNKVCPMMLGNKKQIYDICYHGFGIGFVGDPPFPENVGNIQSTVDRATGQCDKITNVPIYNEQCYSGVFHQMLSYMQNSEYDYKFPSGDDVYLFCNKFGTSKVRPCIEQLGPVLTIVVTDDVAKITDLVNKKFGWLDKITRSRLLQTVVGGAVHANTDDKDASSMIFCFSLKDNDVTDCITGVFSGVKTKSAEGDVKALERLVSFCLQEKLSSENQKVCIDFLKASVKDPVLNKEVRAECAQKKDKEICKLI